jgi:hypothetical protein
LSNNKRARTIIRTLIHKLAEDNPSNWGGWQGGSPGDGSPLKGLRSNSKSAASKGFQLSGKKTVVVFNPTKKQSENDLDTKDPMLSKPDQLEQKPTKQVKEGIMSRTPTQRVLKKLLDEKYPSSPWPRVQQQQQPTRRPSLAEVWQAIDSHTVTGVAPSKQHASNRLVKKVLDARKSGQLRTEDGGAPTNSINSSSSTKGPI